MKNDPLKIDKSKPVLVTGATGYVAGWIVKKLLDEGFHVHAAVRDPDTKEKTKYLDHLAEGRTEKLTYFAADLLSEGSYEAAMKGCQLVFHTASPFTMDIKDAQKELIDPALLGTRNVLNTANETSSVERVVLTSSCAAIYGDNIDALTISDGQFTEAHWNETSTLKHQPYFYSKTVAEKEAWSVSEQQTRWQLVVINPSLVIGPGINPHATSESFRLMGQFGDGSLKSGAPKWGLGVVDVRDLADAHFNAGVFEHVEGRHIVSAHNTDFLEMAQILEKSYAAYPLPRKYMPKWLVWLLAPLVNKSMTREMVSKNVGYLWAADNGKSLTDLKMTYRPLEESVTEIFQQLIDSKSIPKR